MQAATAPHHPRDRETAGAIGALLGPMAGTGKLVDVHLPWQGMPDALWITGWAVGGGLAGFCSSIAVAMVLRGLAGDGTGKR